jgi:rRNA maturation endonuclease Nob1
MEEEFYAVCEACETETQVLVMDNEEEPRYCPMCGTPLEFEDVID